MRAILPVFMFIALIGLVWSTHAFLGAYWDVRQIAIGGAGDAELESALLRKGTAAFPALRRGMQSADSDTRLRCAKIMMELGNAEGEEMLLAELKNSKSADNRAEGFLLSAWDFRNGPDEKMRRRLHEVEGNIERVPATLVLLNECLNRYPGWADGYARRARLYQMSGEAFDARRDALAALSLAPAHFEARVTLGRVAMSVDAPYLAYKSFEHAIAINPRLKKLLKRDLEDAGKALDLENTKRREEKRKNVPVA